MAMPMGNAVTPEIKHFPAVITGGEMQYRPPPQQQQQQWFVDERDGFMNWLRSEFAAANAIIDCLCHHLRVVGEGGEYDPVVGAIQQRRCNWNQVLLMQQYYSVSEVAYALQQVAWRRQQRVVKPVAREFKKVRQWQRFEGGGNVKEGCNSGVEFHRNEANSTVKGTRVVDKSEELKSGGKVGVKDDKSSDIAEEKKDTTTNHQSDGILKSPVNSQGSLSSAEYKAEDVNEEENDSHSIQNQHQNENGSFTGKTFTANEMFDGKTVNAVEGLKLYEDLFDSTEVSKLVSLVNDLRVAGRKGQLQGNQTYVVSKRPMRGRGREMIQLGVPIAYASPDVDNVTASTKDKNMESIPSLFEDIIERMAASQVMNVKPDACIVDFYNEGDHSMPNSWPSWFGRPVYMLFLTECDMTFGRTIVSEHPGDYRGTIKLSLVPGSLLSMQGRSTDFAKHAIPSIHKQRILVTFTKSQPKKSLPIDAQGVAAPATSHWSATPTRSPNHISHNLLAPKHYSTVQVTGVLPAPSLHAPPNSMQPLFMPAPVAPPMQFSTPVPVPSGSTGWTTAPPRHPPPRVLVPGTGVFLPPPGSANSSHHLQGTSTEVNLGVGTPTSSIKENGKSNHSNTSVSPKGKMSGNIEKQECNGNTDGTEVEKAIEEDGESNGETVASH
ncbi:RNA demethylase ALKBH10B-like isoform X2 [Cicer arietinum]|uniref:RNA demethylase ALKBH10B-like isoform X2 n=1 Tax=Cicer arietinum TaxID=3827 RepID=A0A1S2Z1C4_CICAR|nr:RNA demethylase ALKBH10B-like isoform X2 [Cicer arietinum]